MICVHLLEIFVIQANTYNKLIFKTNLLWGPMQWLFSIYENIAFIELSFWLIYTLGIYKNEHIGSGLPLTVGKCYSLF